ncbi:hypothetical protein [Streptomyces sp. Amel2xC10]|uniref:hypothetical protein n=1 Tax=Streptomyces sp. Amel2xC10 TaxID=1305826 RepID=UPI000A08BDD3|nr:hypothetical protein [Streptomyces sp. Amel2xC10]SMF46328.1 hypothetical protein SAMN02745830_03669 [Streptomyces sp. Amel2xC10]
MHGAAILAHQPKANAAGSAAAGLAIAGPLGALFGAALSSSRQVPRRVQLWRDETGRVFAEGG